MKLPPGFTAELSLRMRESPYYVSKEHTAFSDEVIPSQVPPNMPPPPEPGIGGFTFTRLTRLCLPTFRPIKICPDRTDPDKCWITDFKYTGMVCID
jgi:hypothetical protein